MNNIARPTKLSDLAESGSRYETFFKLRDARIVVADYSKIRTDFPWLADHPDDKTGHGAIDRWMLSNCAAISQSHVEKNEVNSDIRICADETINGIRPPSHGRSAVLEVSADSNPSGCKALVSVKGLGVSSRIRPVWEPQRNGLIPLYCALYEFLMHNLVAEAFRHVGSPHRVLPAYAVIDTGFDEIELETRSRRPAGLLVRSAHYRPKNGVDVPKVGSALQRAVADAEFTLRHFGISSNTTSPWMTLERTPDGYRIERAGKEETNYSQEQLAYLHSLLGLAQSYAFDGLSLQYTDQFDWGAGGLELVDLHYDVRRRFDLPLVSTVCDRTLAWGGKIDVDHPRFVQPLPELLAAMEDWISRCPTPDEMRSLCLTDSGPQEGGIFLCMKATQDFREKGAEQAESLLSLVYETANRWPKSTNSLR